MFIQEYACFLHPEQKGQDLDATCPKCQRPFRFPLLQRPAAVNGKEVIRDLGRGYYSAVYVTEHPVLGPYAVKVIPVGIYKHHAKDFDTEARRHVDLAKRIASIPSVTGAGRDVLSFGDADVECHWLEMELADGVPLKELIAKGPEDPRQVAQIALDLLVLLAELAQMRVKHNDLHPENILVGRVPESHARRAAIDGYVSVSVLDLGSADEVSKSSEDRFGDTRWIAEHILALVNQYERLHGDISVPDQRLCIRLRAIAEIYCQPDAYGRQPNPQDMMDDIWMTYQFGERPWERPVKLASVAAHYNAQTLPPDYAPLLFHDPAGWSQQMRRPGPQLVVGMRGCGKTMLLRSAEWAAVSHPRKDEELEALVKRLGSDQYLGLFASYASLVGSTTSSALLLPLHRLLLAYAREVVRNLHACELRKLGEINYEALKSLCGLVRSFIRWYTAPAAATDIVATERSLYHALQSVPPDAAGLGELNPREAFDGLAYVARRLARVWEGKALLFLLDDVSTRYLPLDHVQTVISHLCIQSPDFAFKISTEKQTLELATAGGEAARPGRDYEVFDLGMEVLANLRNGKGGTFLDEILYRRARITDGVPDARPTDILGTQPLASIAGSLRQGKTRSVYWGIDALAGLCVGDIGDVLLLYERMLERSRSRGFPVPHDIQHKTMLDDCEQKLFTLASRDTWLYAHATSFAEASNCELRASSEDRMRQYAEVFVELCAQDAESLFPYLIRLIDNGVFVFTGGTPRARSASRSPTLQFKFAYRKLLGLTNGVPLSMRDRFELRGDPLGDWLREPGREKLIRGKASDADRTPSASPEPGDDTKPDRQMLLAPAPVAQGSGCRETMIAHVEQISHPLRMVEVRSPGALGAMKLDFEHIHIIAAYGFEDRSIGAWEALLQAGTPHSVTMLEYPDPGHKKEIVSRLASAGVPFRELPSGSVPATETIADILPQDHEGPIALDTTSLTKALIFWLAREILLARAEAIVLHTCAAQYFPLDADLERVEELLKSGQFPAAVKVLKELVFRSRGPYECHVIGKQERDPSQSTFMAAFTSLKPDTTEELLKQLCFEEIAAIAPLSTGGATSARTMAAETVARYFADSYGGVVHGIDSLDCEGAYQTLLALHREHALTRSRNFEIVLTGTKMHAVGAGMFSVSARPASVYYSKARELLPRQYTEGTGATNAVHLKVTERSGG